MAVDAELAKTLTLLRTSPTFAATQRDDGSLILGTPDRITPASGVFWLAAQTTLANDQTVESVVIINTATGDLPHAVYWWIKARWFEPADPQDRPAAFAALDATEADVFPYSTATHIPLDIA